MNVAQMLAYGPTLKSQPERWQCRFVTGPSAESVEKGRLTKMRLRHEKWRRYFAQFPDMTATKEQLAAITKQSPKVIPPVMNILMDDCPPAVVNVNGAWKWIGD